MVLDLEKWLWTAPFIGSQMKCFTVIKQPVQVISESWELQGTFNLLYSLSFLGVCCAVQEFDEWPHYGKRNCKKGQRLCEETSLMGMWKKSLSDSCPKTAVNCRTKLIPSNLCRAP